MISQLSALSFSVCFFSLSMSVFFSFCMSVFFFLSLFFWLFFFCLLLFYYYYYYISNGYCSALQIRKRIMNFHFFEKGIMRSTSCQSFLEFVSCLSPMWDSFCLFWLPKAWSKEGLSTYLHLECDLLVKAASLSN